MENLNSRSVLSPNPHLWVKLGSYNSYFGVLPYISFTVAFIPSECIKSIGKAYVESLNSRSVLPAPPHGSNWGHKIADFEFLPYISFIVAFIASECIKRYWESICGESK